MMQAYLCLPLMNLADISKKKYESFQVWRCECKQFERIENVKNIIKQYGEEELMIIISAIGKNHQCIGKVVKHIMPGEKKTHCNYLR